MRFTQFLVKKEIAYFPIFCFFSLRFLIVLGRFFHTNTLLFSMKIQKTYLEKIWFPKPTASNRFQIRNLRPKKHKMNQKLLFS